MAHTNGALRLLVLLVPLLLFGSPNDTSGLAAPPVPAVHILSTDDRMYSLAADGGFAAVVQVFPWRDIEPTRDEWHWERPDFAVRAADYYGLELIVRLDHPPDWALVPTQGSATPPIDLEAYARFVETVARRYRGQVQAYIIWNEPNLSREWAGRPPDATAYSALLCRAYAALKAADPGATIISAGLAPTNGGGDEAMDDRLFLREMYEAGAGACFDALGAHAYGFGHPPDDPFGAHDGLNLARLTDLREIMTAHGGSAVSIWITELGWTSDGTGAHAWQTVSAEQQGDYLARAWQYISREWPWVQVVTIWNLGHGLPSTDEMAGYSLLYADGAPKPAYRALADLLTADQNEVPGDWIEHQGRVGTSATESEIAILAADEVVHLGDNQ
jgi:GH35 family endo-1,4-beta-xylanase